MLRIRMSVVWMVTTLLIGETRPSVANFTIGTQERSFQCNQQEHVGNLLCAGNATASPIGDLSLTGDAAWRDQSNRVGMALGIEPTALQDEAKSRWESFRTEFAFRIEPSPFGAGEGMAFVMLNETASLEGLASPSGVFTRESGNEICRTLAVEFDVTGDGSGSDPSEISDNHVGVDVRAITSLKLVGNAWDVNVKLADNRSVFAWIEYDSASTKLEVRISPNDSRPAQAFLMQKVNLSDVFDGNLPVWVGFSAANAGFPNVSRYTVHNWTFEILPSFPALVPAVPGAAAPPGVLDVDDDDDDDAKSSSKSKIALMAHAGVTSGVVVLLVLSGVFLYCWRTRTRTRSRHAADSDSEGGDTLEELDLVGIADGLRYKYKQLSVATGQFREESKLGQGGFGSVYRGVMPSTGQLVAVKRVNTDSKQGVREFVAEVSIISQLRHRNIVKLLGWCSDRGKFLLVYEFMPNGSLDKALFYPTRGSVLSWTLRHKIVAGAAEALYYLHEGWRQKIIHRDIKSSNIMLDRDYNAMLGDFGLARMVNRHEPPATTMVAGTLGYIAPEAPATAKFTEKTDVFAFGAVALEIACGRAAYNGRLPEDERTLADWVWGKLAEGKLMSVVDPRLEGRYNPKKLEVLLLLGLLCSHPNPDDRPRMRQVVAILGGSVAMPAIPSSKPIISAAFHMYRGLQPQRVQDAVMPFSTTSLDDHSTTVGPGDFPRLNSQPSKRSIVSDQSASSIES